MLLYRVINNPDIDIITIKGILRFVVFEKFCNFEPFLLQNSDPQHKDWQEGLRALLPNVNISFGGSSCYTNMASLTQQQQQMSQHRGAYCQFVKVIYKGLY